MPNDAIKAIYPGFSKIGNSRLWRLETGSQRQQRGAIRPTSGQYLRLPNDTLDIITPSIQQLNLSGSGVRKIGSVPPSGNTSGFAYTSTTTTITWYWDGTNGSTVIVITRADGSKLTVPTSGSGLQVTGLTINTMYYFLPFWNDASTCNIGWVAGTAGTPQIAFVVGDTTDVTNTPLYLMQQSQQGMEPLSVGFMTASTTAGGSGGGGAGGGGAGGHCVMSGTDIEPLGRFDYHINVYPETQWVRLGTDDGKILPCTLDHPLYHADKGRVPADQIAYGDCVITMDGIRSIKFKERFLRSCSKWEVKMKDSHLFWANGFLSHNTKYSSA